MILQRLDVSIAARLRQMRRNRRREGFHIPKHAFDFIDGVAELGIVEDAVRAAFDGESKHTPLIGENFLVL